MTSLRKRCFVMLCLNNNPVSLGNHLSLWNFPWKDAQSDFNKPDNGENCQRVARSTFLLNAIFFFFICLCLIPSCQEEDFWKSYRKTDKRQGEHMFLKWFHYICHMASHKLSSESRALYSGAWLLGDIPWFLLATNTSHVFETPTQPESKSHHIILPFAP